MTLKLDSQTMLSFTPGLEVKDPLAAYWLNQVTLRLRREIAWLWHEQGILPEAPDQSVSPRVTDPVPAILDQKRFWVQKQKFFQSDPTAKFLSEQMALPQPEMTAYLRGSFSWVVKTLELNELESLVLALVLSQALDNSLGPVIAACLHETGRSKPNLALVQKLWDQPEAVMALADLTHPLYRFGLLQSPALGMELGIQWERPLTMSPLIAQQLLFPETALLDTRPSPLAEPSPANEVFRLVKARLSYPSEKILFVPILGAKGSLTFDLAQALGQQCQKKVAVFAGDYLLLKNPAYFNAQATLCWLKNQMLFLNADQVTQLMADKLSLESEQLPQLALPITIFLSLTERRQITRLPVSQVLPLLELPRLTYRERREYWQQQLGDQARGLETLMAECSRRFRFEKNTIEQICRGLKKFPSPLTPGQVYAACRAELELDLGELAQPVMPRFQEEDLILPPKQAGQFQEIIRAMQALTEVHYEWGTEKVWNESGISVLFAGPPGTGKTMAAEILARELNLPMYRIDLSQVASKYIGETEKNLKRVFDAADISDTILFFDEADALFGRRTEVKDAHDRYANLEISYLLERMERFKGLAILATNRKKDLDEAFLRRLRYIVDFPLPGEEERKKIWRQVIPKSVDASSLDLGFLARQFTLAGGHIRSIVFNACLQSTGPASPRTGYAGKLGMEKILIALKREYEKMNRSLSLEQFGIYASVVERVELGHAGN